MQSELSKVCKYISTYLNRYHRGRNAVNKVGHFVSSKVLMEICSVSLSFIRAVTTVGVDPKAYSGYGLTGERKNSRYAERGRMNATSAKVASWINDSGDCSASIVPNRCRNEAGRGGGGANGNPQSLTMRPVIYRHAAHSAKTK